MQELKHIAIIMDGNGRWASSRSRPRVWGHVRGAGVVSDIVEAADNLGIKALTLYAFSTENWGRPQDEIRFLFRILKKFLIKEEARIIKNNIVFRVIGHLEGVPADTLKLIKNLENKTSEHTGLNLTFAFGYGGRTEIVDAVNSFITKNPGKAITKEELQAELYNPKSGDVDLLIRTGGDQRISNFLLWQIAYAELFFTETKWPDFTEKTLKEIIEQVIVRERRFGLTQKMMKTIHDAEKIAEENKNKFEMVNP